MSDSKPSSSNDVKKEEKMFGPSAVQNRGLPETRAKMDLIETILGEMKNEFNRSPKKDKDKKPLEESILVKKDLVDPLELKDEKLSSQPIETEIRDTIKCEADENHSISNTSKSLDTNPVCATGLDNMKALRDSLDEQIMVSDPINKSDAESKIGEGPSEVSVLKKSKNKPNICKSNLNPSEEQQNIEPAPLKSVKTTPALGKRSLRSQTAVKTPIEDLSSVKRSARRRSKDLPRESVLQSAIARKEKSFSSMGQSDDRFSSKHLKACSPRRMSPNDRGHWSASKTGHSLSKASSSEIKGNVVSSKSNRVAAQTQLEKNQSVSEIFLSGEVTNKTSQTQISGRTTTKTNNEQALSSTKTYIDTTTKPSTPTLGLGSQSLTKTGKRRYKPFKGLRYSFTSGTKKNRLQKRQLKVLDASNTSDNSVELNVTSDDVPLEGLDVKVEEVSETIVCPKPEDMSYSEPTDKVLLNSFRGADVLDSQVCTTKVKDVYDEVVATEAIEQMALKRQLEPDDENTDDSLVKYNDDKRTRLECVPSPSPGDTAQGPAIPTDASQASIILNESLVVPADIAEKPVIPEFTAKETICLCKVNPQLYVYQESLLNERLYCQAQDLIDERTFGCCNPLEEVHWGMMRASARTPYLLLCAVHRHMLLRHICCPGCGFFCLQGKFAVCASHHVYHLNCAMMVLGSFACLHCGQDPLDRFMVIDVHAGKSPIFFPHPQVPKKRPSAKMCFGGSHTTHTKPDEVPLTESIALTSESVTEMPETFTTDLEKEKLANFLSVASSMLTNPVPAHRYTAKSLYSAAKNGNTEKLISVLATGLNPNILFRECLMGSVLHLSSSSGHLSVVQILVQAGAQLDVLDRAQNTPLMLAVLEGKNEVVNFLIKAGASVMLKGMGGMTALHLATKSGNQQACQHILAIPNLPRDFIDTKDDGGWTPLVWAAEHSHAHIVEYLLSKRANPFVRDAEQNIALHWSAFSGCAEITELLLNLGSDPNSTNLYGDTPLHIGARQNMYECVHLLLARRARLDLKNTAGELALDCCVSESSECFKAISLNIMLRDIVVKTLEPTVHILSNDISHGKEVNPVQCINWEDDEGEPTDYVYVSSNCFTSYISIDQTITSLQSCRCTDGCTSTDCRCNTISLGCPYDNMGRLVPDFNYADAPMVFECNQMCACNRNRCVNRVMQKSVTEHVQLFRTRSKGWGVRMLRPIPKGTYVCEYIGDIVHDVDRYIGEAITDVEADHREDDSYLFDLDNKDGETYCIDARHYGNVSRFINHMCVPNLIPVKVFVDHHDLHFPRIAFFANRDIDTYEELGFDYGEKFWIIKSKSFTCECGADNCRYSKTTITQTLENYLNRLQEMDRT